MGLKDIFRKITGGDNPEAQARRDNLYVLDELAKRLWNRGDLTVDKDRDSCSVTINGGIRIAVGIFDYPGAHPHLFTLQVRITGGDQFPGGVDENIASMGTTLEQKVSGALNILFDMLLDTLFRSMKEVHNGDDLTLQTSSREILLHPYLGRVYATGHLRNELDETTLYKALEHLVLPALRDQKFNWVKLYIAKAQSGERYYDCYVNNYAPPGVEPVLHSLAADLEGSGPLVSVRQWIFFRRCDQHGNESKPTSPRTLQAVSCFTRNDTADQVLADLYQLFPTRTEALQYFYFIPMIFCRIRGGIPSVLFSAKYYRTTSGNSTLSYHLASNTIFQGIAEIIEVLLLNVSDNHLRKILDYSGEYRAAKALPLGEDQFAEGLIFEMDFTQAKALDFRFLVHNQSKADLQEITALMLRDVDTNGNFDASRKQLEARGFSETYIALMEATVMEAAARNPL